MWIDIGIMVVQVLILAACVIVEGRVRRVEKKVVTMENEELKRWMRQVEVNDVVIERFRHIQAIQDLKEMTEG